MDADCSLGSLSLLAPHALVTNVPILIAGCGWFRLRQDSASPDPSEGFLVWYPGAAADDVTHFATALPSSLFLGPTFAVRPAFLPPPVSVRLCLARWDANLVSTATDWSGPSDVAEAFAANLNLLWDQPPAAKQASLVPADTTNAPPTTVRGLLRIGGRPIFYCSRAGGDCLEVTLSAALFDQIPEPAPIVQGKDYELAVYVGPYYPLGKKARPPPPGPTPATTSSSASGALVPASSPPVPGNPWTRAPAPYPVAASRGAPTSAHLRNQPIDGPRGPQSARNAPRLPLPAELLDDLEFQAVIDSPAYAGYPAPYDSKVAPLAVVRDCADAATDRSLYCERHHRVCVTALGARLPAETRARALESNWFSPPADPQQRSTGLTGHPILRRLATLTQLQVLLTYRTKLQEADLVVVLGPRGENLHALSWVGVGCPILAFRPQLCAGDGTEPLSSRGLNLHVSPSAISVNHVPLFPARTVVVAFDVAYYPAARKAMAAAASAGHTVLNAGLEFYPGMGAVVEMPILGEAVVLYDAATDMIEMRTNASTTSYVHPQYQEVSPRHPTTKDFFLHLGNGVVLTGGRVQDNVATDVIDPDCLVAELYPVLTPYTFLRGYRIPRRFRDWALGGSLVVHAPADLLLEIEAQLPLVTEKTNTQRHASSLTFTSVSNPTGAGFQLCRLWPGLTEQYQRFAGLLVANKKRFATAQANAYDPPKRSVMDTLQGVLVKALDQQAPAIEAATERVVDLAARAIGHVPDVIDAAAGAVQQVVQSVRDVRDGAVDVVFAGCRLFKDAYETAAPTVMEGLRTHLIAPLLQRYCGPALEQMNAFTLRHTLAVVLLPLEVLLTVILPWTWALALLPAVAAIYWALSPRDREPHAAHNDDDDRPAILSRWLHSLSGLEARAAWLRWVLPAEVTIAAFVYPWHLFESGPIAVGLCSFAAIATVLLRRWADRRIEFLSYGLLPGNTSPEGLAASARAAVGFHTLQGLGRWAGASLYKRAFPATVGVWFHHPLAALGRARDWCVYTLHGLGCFLANRTRPATERRWWHASTSRASWGAPSGGACRHVSEEEYTRAVVRLPEASVLDVAVNLGGRWFARDPPRYTELACTCALQRPVRPAVRVRCDGRELEPAVYAACDINVAYVIWGRHYGRTTEADPAYVARVAECVNEHIRERLVPWLLRVQAEEPERLVVDYDAYVAAAIPQKRAAYTQELAAWQHNAHLPARYRPFLKLDEAMPTLGSAAAGKPRAIIEAYGRSVPINAPLKVIADLVKDTVPTFSADSPLQAAARLDAHLLENPDSEYCSADGSNWDQTQEASMIRAVDHAVLRAVFPFLRFETNHWFLPAHYANVYAWLFEIDRTMSLGRLGRAQGRLRTLGYTLSGLGVQNSFNYLRAYFGTRPLLAQLPAVSQWHTGDDALFSQPPSATPAVVAALDALYVPLDVARHHLRTTGQLLRSHCGWTRKTSHAPTRHPETLSKVFVRLAGRYVPIRPLKKLVATGLVNWSGMRAGLHHAAVSAGYAPWGSGRVDYYAMWASWRASLTDQRPAASVLRSLWFRATRENPLYKRPTDLGPSEPYPGAWNAEIEDALAVRPGLLELLAVALASPHVVVDLPSGALVVNDDAATEHWQNHHPQRLEVAYQRGVLRTTADLHLRDLAATHAPAH